MKGGGETCLCGLWGRLVAERSRKHCGRVVERLQGVSPSNPPPFMLSDSSLGQVPGRGYLSYLGSRALKTPIR